MEFGLSRAISLDKNSDLEKTMRQTAEKAVPLAIFTAKPQRECAQAQKPRETPGENPGNHPAQSRVYYHSEVRTPYRKRCLGKM